MSDVVRLQLASRGTQGMTGYVIEQLLAELRQAKAARVIVLEGASGTFCRGLDLTAALTGARELGRASIEGTLELLQQLLKELRSVPQPVLAVVDGDATAGAVGLVAAADIVLASPRATFSLPETLLGLIPGVVFPYLAERIGAGRTRALALLGEKITAGKAAEWGLVDAIADDLIRAEGTLLERLLGQDPLAQGEFKRLAAMSSAMSDSYAEAAVTTFSALLAGPEPAKRIARFIDGRKPREESS